MEKTFACFVGKEIRVIRGCKISSQKFYIVSKKRVAFARHSRNDRAPSRNFWGLHNYNHDREGNVHFVNCSCACPSLEVGDQRSTVSRRCPIAKSVATKTRRLG